MNARSTRRTLFGSPALRIGHLVTQPVSDACGEVERSSVDVLVLPLAGRFIRHDGARRHVLLGANHAALFAREQPYRISNPAGAGDECLTLVFAPERLACLLSSTVGAESLSSAAVASHCLLSPQLMLGRSLLYRRLQQRDIDGLEAEETSLALFASVLLAASAEPHRAPRVRRKTTVARRHHQVETIKEALCARPHHRWTLASLAHLTHTTPYHLTRLFRDDVGVPVHRYLMRVRMAQALDVVLDGGVDLTAVALAHGFASHSHFSASFRALFGWAPSALRNGAARRALADLRKNLTASRGLPP
jgi:AraC-like DNA-binding protein